MSRPSFSFVRLRGLLALRSRDGAPSALYQERLASIVSRIRLGSSEMHSTHRRGSGVPRYSAALSRRSCRDERLAHSAGSSRGAAGSWVDKHVERRLLGGTGAGRRGSGGIRVSGTVDARSWRTVLSNNWAPSPASGCNSCRCKLLSQFAGQIFAFCILGGRSSTPWMTSLQHMSLLTVQRQGAAIRSLLIIHDFSSESTWREDLWNENKQNIV